jgi:predicted Zn-dependent protease
MFAADDVRSSDHERAVELLFAAVGPDDDPLGDPRARVDIAIAYGDLRREDPASALTRLIDLTSTGRADRRIVVWLLGEAYLALRRHADAERVFRTGALDERFGYFSTEPLVRFRLAQALDAQGKVAEAVQSYAEFARHWSNADAELQPLVREARDAIERLRPRSPER